MNNGLKVSVITPLHNDSKFITETINSVLTQTHSNFELIIVDDHSTDNSIDLVKKFNDNRIIIIQNESNRGAAYCRNVGIKTASGDYIAFLDGDDLWSPEKLEKHLNFMIEHKICFSATDYQMVNSEGINLGRYVSGPNIVNHKKMLYGSCIGCLTVMYKRDIYPDLCIPDNIKKRNDYSLWLKLSERTECVFFHECLSFYRKRKSSISSGKKSKLLKHHIILFENLYGYSKFKAFVFAMRNVAFYIYKKLKYEKRIK